MIYEKITLLKANDLKDAKALTLMGTDTERIMTAIRNMHESWASIVQAGVAIWLLERQIYVACVVPTVISLGKPATQVIFQYSKLILWQLASISPAQSLPEWQLLKRLGLSRFRKDSL
jgi:hypothetical protein